MARSIPIMFVLVFIAACSKAPTKASNLPQPLPREDQARIVSFTPTEDTPLQYGYFSVEASVSWEISDASLRLEGTKYLTLCVSTSEAVIPINGCAGTETRGTGGTLPIRTTLGGRKSECTKTDYLFVLLTAGNPSVSGSISLSNPSVKILGMGKEVKSWNWC